MLDHAHFRITPTGRCTKSLDVFSPFSRSHKRIEDSAPPESILHSAPGQSACIQLPIQPYSPSPWVPYPPPDLIFTLFLQNLQSSLKPLHNQTIHSSPMRHAYFSSPMISTTLGLGVVSISSSSPSSKEGKRSSGGRARVNSIRSSSNGSAGSGPVEVD